MNQTQDNEIDFFNFFLTLWVSKFVIIAFVILFSLIGFGYTKVVQPKYKIFFEYSINLPIESYRRTMYHQKLTDLVSNGEVYEIINDINTISLLTTIPLSKTKLETKFKSAILILKNQIYADALYEVAFLEKSASDLLLSTETIAKKLMNSKFIVRSIEEERNVIITKQISIGKNSPNVPIILTFSILLGVMFGVLFVIVRNFKKDQKKQLVET
jgi:hypothetical protein